MSDPMTNTEVEDVLASIRRLVSDDNRPEPEENTAARADRLVLTPALRVMEDPADDLAASEDSDMPETQAVPDSDTPEDVEGPALGQAEPSHEDHGYEDAEDSASDVDVDDGLDDPVDQDIDARDAPIALDAVDLDQDTLMSIQDAFADGDGRVDASDDGAAPSESNESVPLSEKIAALETLIAGQTNEFEPDMAGDGENAGTEPPTLEWEDASDIDVQDAREDTIKPEVESTAEEGQLFASDEDVLDEEALRDLVSDIVREELQGALGERITRNVRKLVRREIQRALAAQDLE